MAFYSVARLAIFSANNPIQSARNRVWTCPAKPWDRDDEVSQALKPIVDIDRYTHARGLSGDIKKLTDDYQAAAKQFFATIRNFR
ncbi:hypothetical protein HX866_27995 [Pseudomonas gingeri]|uniref:hypothetical protein n=1 Tax=Pseudomonas gingeri TaxID=117681 RepID=UPI0015A1B3BF|nr:hypothetical protein [Pseudomonas gingeri]NWA28735.1 hypothetical protein [Pseudomonas gingeri]NWD77426.1 hypothetical protein [Pseudomonas gingeri]